MLQLATHSDIGKEVLHELARKKDKVYTACCDMRKCEEERKNIVLGTRSQFVTAGGMRKGCVGVTCPGYPQEVQPGKHGVHQGVS